MTWFLIRHGETNGNRRRVLQRPEEPLSEKGRGQAERLARRIENLGGVSRVLASDLERALATAKAVSQLCEVPLVTHEILQERNFGDFRGRAYAEIGFDVMAPEVEPPGGESWEVFHERVARAWQWLRTELEVGVGPVAVVTHGLVCASLTSRHLVLPPHAVPPARWGNTSLTVVEGEPPVSIRLLNCTAHLDRELADEAGALV